jgi:hypothetical protein
MEEEAEVGILHGMMEKTVLDEVETLRGSAQMGKVDAAAGTLRGKEIQIKEGRKIE